MLTRDQILAADDRKSEVVQVPEWGGSVTVAAMSGAARDAWEASLVIRKGTKVEPNMQNMRARLVAACVVDEAGALMFSSADVEALGQKSGAALERVCKVAQRMNALTDGDMEAAKGN